MPHIAVIGAGITGVTTADALLERGYSVTVIDRQRYAAMETSFANGGQLSASNAEVWNSWGAILRACLTMRLAIRPGCRHERRDGSWRFAPRLRQLLGFAQDCGSGGGSGWSKCQRSPRCATALAAA